MAREGEGAMGEDTRDLLNLITFGLVLALATAFLPDVIVSSWPPSTAWSHNAGSDLQPEGAASLGDVATLPAALVPDACHGSGVLARPHDWALEAAQDAIIRGAVARKIPDLNGRAGQRVPGPCPWEGSSCWASPMPAAILPCAEPP